MKKVMTKFMALLLAVFFVLSFGACGKQVSNTSSGTAKATAQGTTQGTVQSTAQSTTISQAATGKFKLPISDQPVTLTILATDSTSMPINNDVMTFKELEKRTNIHLEWQLLPAQNPEEKFNLIMMSGKLPDVVSYGNNTTNYKYAMQGAFIPLETQIKKYAPNLQKIIDNPPFPIKNCKLEMCAGDGHIYNIPIYSDNYVGELFFMREDWLNNISMKTPTTTDELYTVLKAFKEKDPNKNGLQDEIPYSGESNLGDLRALMASFGARKTFYVAKDNTIKFSPIADKDRHLEALNYLRKLYSEGLIDQELITQTRAQYDAKATTDKIGMIYAWSISGADAANSALKKLSPEKRFVGVLPVKGPHGDQIKEDPQAKMTPRLMVSKDNKNVEATMKWIDYMFTEEGRLLLSYGLEGKTYNMVNGMPKRVKFDDPSQNPQKAYGLVFPAVTMMAEMKDSYSTEVMEAFELNTKSGVMDERFPNLPLGEEDQALKAKVEAEMLTYINENLAKLITGADPISKFDSYIEGFNKIGVDKLLTAYNAAYKKYLDWAK